MYKVLSLDTTTTENTTGIQMHRAYIIDRRDRQKEAYITYILADRCKEKRAYIRARLDREKGHTLLQTDLVAVSAMHHCQIYYSWLWSKIYRFIRCLCRRGRQRQKWKNVKKTFHRILLARLQCARMDVLFIQYSAIYSNKNLPNMQHNN